MAKQQKTFTKVVLKRRREDITKPRVHRPKSQQQRRQERKESKVQQPRDLALRNDYHELYRILLKNQMKGLEKMQVPWYVNREEKLAFVVLIQERTKYLPGDMCKVLDTLRLHNRFDGVFVRLSEDTYPLLRLADPMIAWGYPDSEHIRTLILKHAYCATRKTVTAKDGAQSVVVRREPLQNNQLIEDHLGAQDVICLEDIIDVLLKPEDKRFPHVNAFLWPFKLNAPANRLPDETLHFVHGGSRGNREEYINALIDRML